MLVSPVYCFLINSSVFIVVLLVAKTSGFAFHSFSWWFLFSLASPSYLQRLIHPAVPNYLGLTFSNFKLLSFIPPGTSKSEQAETALWKNFFHEMFWLYCILRKHTQWMWTCTYGVMSRSGRLVWKLKLFLLYPLVPLLLLKKHKACKNL